MLWFAAVMIRAYNDARVKSDKIRKLWYTVVSDKKFSRERRILMIPFNVPPAWVKKSNM